MTIVVPDSILPLVKSLNLSRIQREKCLSFIHTVLSHQLECSQTGFNYSQQQERRSLTSRGYLPPTPLSSQLLRNIYDKDFMRDLRRLLGPTGLNILFVGESYQVSTKPAGIAGDDRFNGSCKLYGILFMPNERLIHLDIAWTPRWKERGRKAQLSGDSSNGGSGRKVDMGIGRRWVIDCLSRINLRDERLVILEGMEPCRRHLVDLALARFRSGDFRGTMDRHGRLHHLFTNSPKELRACITLDNEELVELDLKACHIFLLLTLIPDKPDEAARLYKLISNEDLYASLSTDGRNDDKLRKRQKVQLLTAINSKTPMAYNFPAYRTFGEKFPAVVDRLDAMKRYDHREAAKYLQRKESHLMLELIATECARRGIPVFSVHDCLFCKASQKNEVLAIMKAETIREMGYEPPISEKRIAA